MTGRDHSSDSIEGDLALADAPTIARAVQAGAVSPVEIVRASLERAERVGSSLGAFTVLLHEQAIARAREIERDVRRGHDVGPLAGVPISVKDAIWLRGAPATNGSLAHADFVPAENSASAARLLGSGAVVIGKTNNPEFCFFGYTDGPLWGPARNPWNRELTAGGSSGGGASSVAAGVTTITLGTDGGGSIRGPASFCGTFGLKPTFGLVPTEPSFRVWPSLSVDGPITSSTADAALALAVLSGVPTEFRSIEQQEHAVRRLRIAWSTDLGYASVDPAVRDRFEAAIELLAATGFDLVEACPNSGDPTRLWTDIAVHEGYAALGELLPEWEERMWPGVAEIIRSGDRPAAETAKFEQRRHAYAQPWDAFFATYDLLLTPMMQVPPFPLGVSGPDEIDGRSVDPFFDDWSNLCYPANLTGQPAASVPIGFTAGQLPTAMQVMSARGRDDAVLAFATAWEHMRPWPAAGEVATRHDIDDGTHEQAARPSQHQRGTPPGARLEASGEIKSDGRRSPG